VARLRFVLLCVGLSAVGVGLAAGGVWLGNLRDEAEQPWYTVDDQGQLADAILAEKPEWGWAAGCIFADGEGSVPQAADLVELAWDRGVGIGVHSTTTTGLRLILVTRRVEPAARDGFRRIEGGGYLCFRPEGPVPQVGVTA
jgi:hypothetical protein